jgi:hypothetical protein
VSPARRARRRAAWRELTKIEPGLQRLLDHIRTIKDDKSRPAFCANGVWYGYYGHPSLKEHMSHLVGWHAANPKLRTMEAYDVAYTKLYSALPDCRNCMCL